MDDIELLVKQSFPGATDEDLETFFWCGTAAFFCGPERLKEQIIDAAKESNGDIRVAIRLAHESWDRDWHDHKCRELMDDHPRGLS